MSSEPQGPEHESTDRSRPRRYDNSRRAADARATRSRIIDAAATSFAESGYAATTIKMIASIADVSPESIYANFGSKSALLRAWIDRAVVGDDENVALLDREDAVTARTAGTVQERRRAQARLVRHINERVAVPMRVLAAAAPGDAELSAIALDYERRRRSDIEVFSDSLTGRVDHVRRDRKVVDLLTVWTSAEVFARLVLDSGWTVDQYEDEVTRIATYLIDRDPTM